MSDLQTTGRHFGAPYPGGSADPASGRRTPADRAPAKVPTERYWPAASAPSDRTAVPVNRPWSSIPASVRDRSATSTGGGPSTAPAAGWRGGHRRPAGRNVLAGAVLAMSVGWVAVVLAAPHLTLSPGWRMVALFCHLTCLVVGFGAVLTVDWFSLRWLLRQERIGTVLTTARGTHLLIWLGLVGLVVSGAALRPDTSSALVQIKLVAVLVVGINGLFLGRVSDRLTAVGDGPVPWSRLLPAAGAATVSQLGWWTATLIGFWNAQH
ncbi:hypothetical protein ACIBF5_25605 [Micromonospora sp. NPDC050417]|uniref:hypothetical protein n=1 Tax=Micromonospora sp. NPDC050417 TaxID=3364280 RepID=UPI003797E836